MCNKLYSLLAWTMNVLIKWHVYCTNVSCYISDTKSTMWKCFKLLGPQHLTVTDTPCTRLQSCIARARTRTHARTHARTHTHTHTHTHSLSPSIRAPFCLFCLFYPTPLSHICTALYTRSYARTTQTYAHARADTHTTTSSPTVCLSLVLQLSVSP